MSPSSSNVDRVDLPNEPVKNREDIGLDNQELLTMNIKDLNRLIKKRRTSKAEQKKIKDKRRTLKNRGAYSLFKIFNVYSPNISII